jgi:hypothetical protein
VVAQLNDQRTPALPERNRVFHHSAEDSRIGPCVS